MDLKNNSNMDLEISLDGDLVLVTGQEAIGQDIKQSLLTHYGESVYARNLGTPWRESILIENSDLYQDTVEQILRNIISNVSGVIAVKTFFFSEFDPEEGYMAIECEVQTIEGEVDFTGENQISLSL